MDNNIFAGLFSKLNCKEIPFISNNDLKFKFNPFGTFLIFKNKNKVQKIILISENIVIIISCLFTNIFSEHVEINSENFKTFFNVV